MGGGDLATLLEDNEDSRAMMEILANVDLGTTAAPDSSFISPHTEFDTSLYPSDLTRQIADMAQRAHPVREDGPDVQTLGEVVAHTFGMRGHDYSEAEWDSWRGEDGKWVISLRWYAAL